MWSITATCSHWPEFITGSTQGRWEMGFFQGLRRKLEIWVNQVIKYGILATIPLTFPSCLMLIILALPVLHWNPSGSVTFMSFTHLWFTLKHTLATPLATSKFDASREIANLIASRDFHCWVDAFSNPFIPSKIRTVAENDRFLPCGKEEGEDNKS